MIEEENAGRLRWDGTISAGTVLAMVGIATSVIGGSAVVMNNMGSMQSALEKQGERFETGLTKLNEKVNTLTVQMAQKDSLEGKISDHENRIRTLEAR